MQDREDRQVAEFDRKVAHLIGLPDVVHTRPSTVHHLEDLVGTSSTFIVRTFRQLNEGDTVFIEYVGTEGSRRIAST